jgi:hypothetical protein
MSKPMTTPQRIQATHHLDNAQLVRKLRNAKPIGSTQPAARHELPRPSAPFAEVLHVRRSTLATVFAVGVLVGSSLICAAIALGMGRIPHP